MNLLAEPISNAVNNLCLPSTTRNDCVHFTIFQVFYAKLAVATRMSVTVRNEESIRELSESIRSNVQAMSKRLSQRTAVRSYHKHNPVPTRNKCGLTTSDAENEPPALYASRSPTRKSVFSRISYAKRVCGVEPSGLTHCAVSSFVSRLMAQIADSVPAEDGKDTGGERDGAVRVGNV